jgi:excisionase family DNA binding protein
LHRPLSPQLLTFIRVAEQLDVSLSQVRRLVAAGELPTVVVGKDARRVRQSDLDAYVKNLPRSA